MAFLGELPEASILDPTAAIPDKRTADFKNTLRLIADITFPPTLGSSMKMRSERAKECSPGQSGRKAGAEGEMPMDTAVRDALGRKFILMFLPDRARMGFPHPVREPGVV
jgi:hypothetical protein